MGGVAAVGLPAVELCLFLVFFFKEIITAYVQTCG